MRAKLFDFHLGSSGSCKCTLLPVVGDEWHFSFEGLHFSISQQVNIQSVKAKVTLGESIFQVGVLLGGALRWKRDLAGDSSTYCL